METIGLLLAVPFAFTGSLVYCSFLSWLGGRLSAKLVTFATLASCAVLLLFACELGLLSEFGALKSREIVGPIFDHAQRICFYFAAPSVANLLMLHFRGFFGRWYLAFLPCALLEILAIGVEYLLFDALYGPDGMGGPYTVPII